MTKIWILSDLHQEFARDSGYGRNPLAHFDPAPHAPDDFDVVVVAGDVEVPLTRSLEWLSARFPGVPVVYTPGNHDFFVEDGEPVYTMTEQIDAGRELAGRLGIHLLLNTSVDIDGTRFMGGTLWTDFRSVGYGSTLSKIRDASGRNGMNDYKKIRRWSTKTEGKRKRLRPSDTIESHHATRAFIESEMAKPFDGARVAVTHHAPHPDSLDPRKSDLNWCYASQLRLLLEDDAAPDLWFHGHVHQARDYVQGNTRVVSNPRGYQFMPDEQNNGFDPSLVIEVPAPSPTPAF